MSSTIYDIPAPARIDGTPEPLRAYAGKVLLVVNVASACGLTPQYEALEKLYERERERGFVILGFPSNDFGAQEPGSNAEIATFCSTTFDVTFPMFEKIAVKGADTHPLYAFLMREQPQATGQGDGFRQGLIKFGVQPDPAPHIMWNFEKFLVARDGRVVARFAPDIAPDHPIIVEAIERELAKPA